ncbi:MAG TPA: hypothetical protein VHO01_10175 [Jatrophihabitans sp.]|nr:hypothetical protein [Jatrophihabitans sp.]
MGEDRRRRRQRTPAAGLADESRPGAEAGNEPDSRQPETGGRGRHQRKSDDRAWRELVGSGPSQVGVSGALRARDVARPGAAELAAAERDVVIVRRQWSPPEN